MPVDLVRDAAIDVLLRVFDRGLFLNESLDRTLKRKPISQRGARFLTQLVYGTTRHRLLCDHVLEPLVHHPLDKMPTPIVTILRMGVFQSLFCNQVTFPAMVHTAVDLAKKRGHAGTARLVNAVLKRVPTTLADVALPREETDPIEHLVLRYSMPKWMIQQWRDDFGLEETRRICEALDIEAPRTARVNLLLNSREELLAALMKAGAQASPHPVLPEAIVFTHGAIPIGGKAFQSGRFFVQDPASMLAAHLLDVAEGQTILDLCAAPGGKATHIAERVGGNARIAALDENPHRLRKVADNIERLQVSGISLFAGDGMAPPFSGGFDRVLVDAPCSGFGTIRRHPDLKWRSHAHRIAPLAQTQCQLLRSAVALCKNNGLIVYSVCTFTRGETEGVVDALLKECDAALEDGPEWMEPWKSRPGQYRILPRAGQLDGYFLTRLRKRR